MSLFACKPDGGGNTAVDASTVDVPDAPPGVVMEVEPNNERDQATQLQTRSAAITIQGVCTDYLDIDYYNAPAGTTGAYSAELSWDVGGFELGFDPEDGFTGELTHTNTSPIVVTGDVVAPTELSAPQFAIDCGSHVRLNLVYTLVLTLP